VTNDLLIWTAAFVVSGTVALGAALMLEHADSQYHRIPATFAMVLYFMACVAAGLALAFDSLVRVVH
jgi:hypothetical protein